MYYFKKLLDTVSKQKGVMTSNPLKDAKWKVKIDPFITPSFLQMAQQCQVFVFSKTGNEPQDVYPLETAETIDAPFRVFSIEVLGGPISSSRPGEASVAIECILVYETKPGKYFLITLYNYEGQPYVFSDLTWKKHSDLDKEGHIEVMMLEEKGEMIPYTPNYHVLGMVQSFLERLTYEAAGAEKVNERTKVKSGDTKGIVKIKRIIHITPKKIKKKYAAINHRHIEWSHRWFSRGHWRELPGKIGKDREGNYCIQNETWVNESTKGPKNKDIIGKTRMLLDR